MHPILLIRHGEAEHHTLGLTGGWTDVPLTPRGQQQLAALGERLAAAYPDVTFRIVSSDLQRAQQSSSILADSLGCSVDITAGLREMNNGLAANKTEQEAKAMSLPLTEPRIDWQHYPEGETRRQFYLRVAACLEQQPLLDQPTIIVAHRGTILNILYWWLHLDIAEAAAKSISFDISPASLTELRINKWQEHTIARLNDTSHLLGLLPE